jgi:nucleoside-diphosphate-sugar epimerase
MRILVFGAAGAIGRQLVPMLIAGGHVVAGTTRDRARASWLTSAGAEPVVVDVFDADAVKRALHRLRPDVVMNQLTDLTAGFGRAQVEATARLRATGSRVIVDAMQASNARRLVAQSAAWIYAPGPTPHTEDDPLRSAEGDSADPVAVGVTQLERLTLETPGIDGVVLRYGYLYGPGTAYATRAEAGDGPTVHVEDAARAAALSAERGAAGVYNIVDDGGTVSSARARAGLGWEPRAGTVP